MLQELTAGLEVISIARKPDQKDWATTDPHAPTGSQASAAAGLAPPLPTIVVVRRQACAMLHAAASLDLQYTRCNPCSAVLLSSFGMI
jgi:hypothetical protein